MTQTFYSNGKLLLAGEYVVLDGADALGLPSAFGQSLEVTPTSGTGLQWQSLDYDGTVWFQDEIALTDILAGTTHATPETATLIKILHTAHQLNPQVLQQGYAVATRLTFPRKWGLGTSSTLISNIAWWFGINPYELLWQSFGGSGYDIACARNNTPVIFRISEGAPVEQQVHFRPGYHQNLWFVYLNQKQDSRTAIRNYQSRTIHKPTLINTINSIVQEIIAADGLEAFAQAAERHEQEMSVALGLPPVKQLLFPDFPGAVKSLGAWGGDFILAASKENPSTYFKEKGYSTILPYNEMILK